MPPLFAFSAYLTSFALLMHLLAEQRGLMTGRAVTKVMASFGFILAALAVGALHSLFGIILLTGLLFCFMGDIFLLGTAQKTFRIGLNAFLIGHLAFITAFLVRGIDPVYFLAAAVVTAVAGVSVFRWLKPHIPRNLLAPVSAYMIIISFMVMAATGCTADGVPPRLLIGALLFYLSDIVVARQRFIKEAFVNRFVGLPLYYTGQFLIASSAGI
jgi:uncharacterized membrane protein YhhN